MGGADRPLRRGGDCSPLSAVRSKSKAYPLTPALSPKGGEGEREQIGGFSKLGFGLIFWGMEPICMLFKARVRLDILGEREPICMLFKA
jgi:hypothetical protein